MTSNNGDEGCQRPNRLDGDMANLTLSETTTPVDSSTGDGEEIDAQKLASDMQQRCRTLLQELEQFQAHLKQKKKQNDVELRTFKTGLQAEMKLIDKLASKSDTPSTKTAHSLRSSNFLFYATVWATAKSCKSVTALSRRFYWIPGKDNLAINGKIAVPGTRHKSHSAVVDIVCQDGLEWIKVSSNTEKRIIWDMAKAGWVGDSDSEESDFEDDDEPQGLLKQAQALMKASRATRVRYRHPKVRLVLPRISCTPKAKEVGMVLQKIRNLGVTVQTMEDISAEPMMSDVLERLTADRAESFSDVLNVDCTVLLAFASDLSHGRVEPEDWHNKMISRQREMEAEEQLLPSSIWPACASKKLVCTREAGIRMQEIVDVIGTPTEKGRAELLMDLSGTSKLTPKDRIEEFQKLSDYTIPEDWQLPIEIVDVDVSAVKENLPPAASILADSLSTINSSVFLYGWRSGRTTISSNRAVAKEIEATVEEHRSSEEDEGPDVWLCSMTRSLVGKEKQRRGGNDNASD